MTPDEVPDELVDLAMTGAKPGCRDDARFYLANVLAKIRADERAKVAEEILTDYAEWKREVGTPDSRDVARWVSARREGAERAAKIARGAR